MTFHGGFFWRIIARCHENPRAPNGATLGDSRTYLRPPGRAAVTSKRVCACGMSGVVRTTVYWHAYRGRNGEAAFRQRVTRRARGENMRCDDAHGGRMTGHDSKHTGGSDSGGGAGDGGGGGGRAPTPQRERRTSSCVRRRSKIAARASISRKEVAAPAAPSADGARGRSRSPKSMPSARSASEPAEKGSSPRASEAEGVQVLAGVGVEQPRMAGAYPGVRRQTRLQAVPPHEKDVLLRAWECKLDQLIPRAPRRRRAMWVATIWLLVPQPGATGSR